MTEWKGPVGQVFRYRFATFVVVITFLLFIIYGGSAEILCCGAVVYPFIIIVAGIYYTHYLSMVKDYEISRWDMEKDHVAGRIDKALRTKGIMVVIDYAGDTVIFPLPPLNIVVAEGYSDTKVYIGPMEGSDPRQVEGLKAFVDAALATVVR